VTPIAARLFRGDEQNQSELGKYQFFECSALPLMAMKMVLDDPPESGFSPNARLPAPFTFLEFMIGGDRHAFACEEAPGNGLVTVKNVREYEGRMVIGWQAGFTPGSSTVKYQDEESMSPTKSGALHAGLLLVEKLLCLINQTGLIERRPRDTDKRVIRLAAKRGVAAPDSRWHQCHLRPGVHGLTGSTDGAAHARRPLHYVRKHLKPSLGADRWIEGFWRGNADLGVYHKTYVGHPQRGSTLQRLVNR
jgi:hypothetical protein